MKKYGFGVDVGGTTCKIGLFETTGKLLEKWEVTTDTSDNGKNILDDVAKALQGKMAARSISISDIQGIGIGIPGPVNEAGVVSVCVNLGWGEVPVTAEMSAKMDGIPVKAANDANVAALGEMWQGGAKGYQDVVMVTLGTGVGGGIIVGGNIVAGRHGAGGEIGHMTVNTEETAYCNCKRRGCLEQYASATGIVRIAKRALTKDHAPSMLDNLDQVTAKSVFDAYIAGDALATDVINEFAEILGRGLSIVTTVVDPEIYVIGGGVSKAGQPLLDVVQREFENSVLGACRDTKFALATLANDAGIYGCVKLIME
jgi:glucokinase